MLPNVTVGGFIFRVQLSGKYDSSTNGELPEGNILFEVCAWKLEPRLC
jgi:hypothetical protein